MKFALEVEAEVGGTPAAEEAAPALEPAAPAPSSPRLAPPLGSRPRVPARRPDAGRSRRAADRRRRRRRAPSRPARANDRGSPSRARPGTAARGRAPAGETGRRRQPSCSRSEARRGSCGCCAARPTASPPRTRPGGVDAPQVAVGELGAIRSPSLQRLELVRIPAVVVVAERDELGLGAAPSPGRARSSGRSRGAARRARARTRSSPSTASAIASKRSGSEQSSLIRQIQSRSVCARIDPPGREAARRSGLNVAMQIAIKGSSGRRRASYGRAASGRLDDRDRAERGASPCSRPRAAPRRNSSSSPARAWAPIGIVAQKPLRYECSSGSRDDCGSRSNSTPARARASGADRETGPGAACAEPRPGGGVR